MPDVDLTSGHFLGLRPAAVADGPLTTGRPAVVGEPPSHTLLAQRLAGTVGAADGLFSRTSFHALLDAIAIRPAPADVLVDEAIYPVGQWAAAAALSATSAISSISAISTISTRAAHPEGGTMRTYRHRDPRDARRAARHARGPLVVVTDGLCGSCLRPAPLAALGELVTSRGGHLVVDDSLAAGVGPGGTGSAGWLTAAPERMLWVASLAKGYAAPVAALAGPADLVARVRSEGPTRMHSSPASACDVDALRQGLADPTVSGRRARLAGHVATVRQHLDHLGLTPLGVPFPLICTEGGRHDPLELRRRLAAYGVRTLATRGRCTGRPTLALCLRADLTGAEVARLLAALSGAAGGRAA